MQYYLFIDECGTPELEKIDLTFPCFGVCGILVSHNNYSDLDLRMKAIKYKYWGHDDVIFRSYNIRNGKKEFTIFINKDDEFMNFVNDVNAFYVESRFKIICPVIHKIEHKQRYGANAHGSYETALTFLLQRTIYCLNRHPIPAIKELSVIIEKRGKPHDQIIHQHINGLIDNGVVYNGIMYTPPYEFRKYIRDVSFKPKKANISGLQLADLSAFPITTKIQKPNKENISFDVLRHKLDHKDGIIDGYGMARFPKIE